MFSVGRNVRALRGVGILTAYQHNSDRYCNISAEKKNEKQLTGSSDLFYLEENQASNGSQTQN